MGVLAKNYDKRASSLKVKIRKIEDVDFCSLLYLKGYIDNQTASILQEDLDKLVSAGYINFIFDCEELDSISSNSIGVFTNLEKRIRPYNGHMVFYDLNGAAYDVFNLLGFYDYFTISTGIDDAIDYLLYKEDEIVPEEKEVFPVSFECPICHVKLKAQKMGKFQCAGCKTVIAISAQGHVSLG